MHEEHGQHLGAGHDADELSMVAQLHVIVWRWCGGAGQPVWRQAERLNDLVADLAGVCLEDAGLIQHHAREAAGIKVAQLLVVGDRDTGLYLSLRGSERAWNAELAALAHGLMRHGKRCQHQHVAAGLLVDLMRPLKLHGSFAHAAVGPDAELADTARHGHDVPLKRKQRSGELLRVKTGNRCCSGF
jgi:hypothetical protein